MENYDWNYQPFKRMPHGMRTSNLHQTQVLISRYTCRIWR